MRQKLFGDFEILRQLVPFEYAENRNEHKRHTYERKHFRNEIEELKEAIKIYDSNIKTGGIIGTIHGTLGTPDTIGFDEPSLIR